MIDRIEAESQVHFGRRGWLGAALPALALLACSEERQPARARIAGSPPPPPPDEQEAPATTTASVASPTLPAAAEAGTLSSAALPRICARATTFQEVHDRGPRTRFVRSADGTTIDWVTIATSAALLAPNTPQQIVGLLAQLATLPLAYPLQLLDHSRQVATRAQRAGASDDLVLAALCHRLGMLFTHEGYAELSAALLRGYVSDDVYRLVRHHAEYSERPDTGITRTSRARYVDQPWHADACRFVDEWIERSWDAAYDALPLSAFEPLIRSKFSLPHDPYLTRHDCARGASHG